jgi:hypothetical protein
MWSNIIWGIVFPEYFNQKLFLFVNFYLSPDKLDRKIYLSGRFYVRVGHGNSTPLALHSHHRTELKFNTTSTIELHNASIFFLTYIIFQLLLRVILMQMFFELVSGNFWYNHCSFRSKWVLVLWTCRVSVTQCQAHIMRFKCWF